MKQNNCAETVDRMQRGVAWGMLLCGITYLIILAEDLTPKGTLNSILDKVTLGGVAITMAVTIFAIWPALKQKLGGQLIGAKGTRRIPVRRYAYKLQEWLDSDNA